MAARSHRPEAPAPGGASRMIASKLKTAPAYMPITRAEGKAQLNIETAFTDDDTSIDNFIKQAAAYFFNRTGRQLIQATWQLALDDWHYSDYCLELPVGPVVEVSSVKYYDESNVLQTLATSEYRLNNFQEPAQLELFGTLPGLYDRTDAVLVEYIAGCGASAANEAAQQAAIDSADKALIKILLTLFYEYRDGNFPSASIETLKILFSERRIYTKTFYEHA